MAKSRLLSSGVATVDSLDRNVGSNGFNSLGYGASCKMIFIHLFQYTKRIKRVTYYFQTILRLCCLRRFGYFIAKMKSIQFTYDTDKCMFFGPLQLESQQDEKSAHEQMVSIMIGIE